MKDWPAKSWSSQKPDCFLIFFYVIAEPFLINLIIPTQIKTVDKTVFHSFLEIYFRFLRD